MIVVRIAISREAFEAIGWNAPGRSAGFKKRLTYQRCEKKSNKALIY
jgi:hypothetical protein